MYRSLESCMCLYIDHKILALLWCILKKAKLYATIPPRVCSLLDLIDMKVSQATEFNTLSSPENITYLGKVWIS